MKDEEIIKLYFDRDEAAIEETSSKYGSYCHKIAFNILSVETDAEECVNDTYLKAWNSIPPQKPDRLGAWLGKVVRNIAINLWNKNHRKKRYAGIEQIFDELSECIPSPCKTENIIEEQELTAFLNRWISHLSKQDRILFIRRYWQGEKLAALAKETGISPSKLAKHMYKLRQNLKLNLEKEGYSL